MYAGTVIPPESIIERSDINHSGLFSDTNKHLIYNIAEGFIGIEAAIEHESGYLREQWS